MGGMLSLVHIIGVDTYMNSIGWLLNSPALYAQRIVYT